MKVKKPFGHRAEILSLSKLIIESNVFNKSLVCNFRMSHKSESKALIWLEVVILSISKIIMESKVVQFGMQFLNVS